MIDVVRYRSLYFLGSLVVMLVGIATLFVEPRLHWSIEFTSGATADVVFKTPVSAREAEDLVLGLGYPGAVAQGLGPNEVFIRMPLGEDPNKQKTAVQTALVNKFGEVQGFDFAQVSPAVARETVRNGLVAVGLAIVAMLIYIVWAFRGVPHAFRWGVAAIVALAHDLVMAFAVAGIAANFVHLELSTMFLVGILTVLGYSINDTIVVFDRIRENVLRETTRDFSTTVNFSILETAGRSFNTSFTTLLALLALWFLGPTTIRDFLLVMIVGVVTGTYSSVFTAAVLLVTWETRSLGTLPRWIPLPRRTQDRPAAER
ncbi:MAG: protein translocase subunit SecF [Chloroflexi bacterium]|nr:protein translocase subunit SecF [Chloroflexota bacterium]